MDYLCMREQSLSDELAERPRRILLLEMNLESQTGAQRNPF